jgi:hypothetical protein
VSWPATEASRQRVLAWLLAPSFALDNPPARGPGSVIMAAKGGGVADITVGGLLLAAALRLPCPANCSGRSTSTSASGRTMTRRGGDRARLATDTAAIRELPPLESEGGGPYH